MSRTLLLAILAALPLAGQQDYDILIRNGRIADGTGNPSYLADLALSGNRIAALGRLTGKTAKRTIDAAGLVVSPGFIDIHNHSDYSLLRDGNAQSFIRQGVTTMIFGEGGSAAPTGGKQQSRGGRLGGGDEDGGFATLRDYFTALLKGGISPNIGTYVGSSQIWTYVHGPAAGPPTPAELTQMRALVKQAMEDGALGVASSLSGPPGSWIDTATMVAMCEAAAPYGGIYSTHMRTEGFGIFESVAEALDIGRRAKVPVDIIHLKLAEHKLWGKMDELLATLAAARRNGQEVEANVYPYRAGQNNLSTIIPPWAHEGGSAALIKRLQDPSLKARLTSEIEHGIPGTNWYNHYTATGSWEGMLLVNFANPAYKRFEGKRMNQVIDDLKLPPIDTLFKVLIDNRGSVPTVYFHHSEDDMRKALASPFVSISSDGTAVATEGPLAAGHPHPRYYGTFPRVLGRYVRDEKVLSLEEAIRKMTSANASKVRVWDRGLLRAGMMADVTVFDAGKIIDHSTFEKPHQYSTGVEYVIVNGTVVLDRGGRHTGARPGGIVFGQGRRP